MQSERESLLVWGLIVAGALLIGWLLGRAFLPEEEVGAREDAAFRAWFWERRTLDLLVQVALIFAGALGVAALLPGYQEMRDIGARKEDHAPLA